MTERWSSSRGEQLQEETQIEELFVLYGISSLSVVGPLSVATINLQARNRIDRFLAEGMQRVV